MNILIVYPKMSRYLGGHYDVQLGLAYISSTLKAKGHQITCVNLNHYSDVSVIKEAVERGNIEVVCTGGQSPLYKQIKSIFDEVREYYPQIITILGGGIITAEPELIYKMISPTYGVIGEGEETIAELMEAVEFNNDVSKVAGVIFSDKDGNIIKNSPRAPIANIDQIPFPDFDGFDVEKFLDNQTGSDVYYLHSLDQRPRMLPIISSRGCPYLCSFCFHPIGTRYRQRSLDNFFAELDLLISKYNINCVNVFDELFAVKKERVYEFCRRITEYNIKWLTQMRVNCVDEETLKSLKESGCIFISYGIESVSNAVLKSMKKAIKVEEINRALELTRKVGITIQGNLIIGDPAETSETVKENIRWVNEHPEYDIGLGFINTYPGTELYFRAIEKGLIKNKEDFLKVGGGALNLTEMPDDQFYKLPLIFEVNNRKTKIRNAGKIVSMSKTLAIKSKGNTYNFEICCPHCKCINKYRKFNILNEKHQSTSLVCKHCLQRYHMIPNLFFAKVLMNYYKFACLLPGKSGGFVFYVTVRLLSLTHFTTKENLDRGISFVKRIRKR